MVERSAMAESSKRNSEILNSKHPNFDRLCDIVARLRAGRLSLGPRANPRIVAASLD